MNTSGYDNGGQAGYHWDSDGDGNIYVAHSAFLSTYFGGSFQLQTPPSGVSYTILFAPTTHGGQTNCIEGVTSYSNGYSWVGQTRGQFQVYDFCVNNFVGSYDMDSTFMNNYVRVWTNSGDSIPKYILEETTLKNTDGYFHALIYNANTTNWDDFYDANSGGTSSRTDGWSIFETHYGQSTDSASEPCSNVGNISDTGLELHGSSGWWEVTSSDVGSGFYYGNCFTSPFSTYFYGLTVNLPNDAQWLASTISCSFDSYGYCSYEISSTDSGGTATCLIGYIGGKPIYSHPIEKIVNVYDIYTSSAFQEQATETSTFKSCPETYNTVWSPNEPKTYYSDPNLP